METGKKITRHEVAKAVSSQLPSAPGPFIIRVNKIQWCPTVQCPYRVSPHIKLYLSSLYSTPAHQPRSSLQNAQRIRRPRCAIENRKRWRRRGCAQYAHFPSHFLTGACPTHSGRSRALSFFPKIVSWFRGTPFCTPAAPACLLSAQNISSCHHRIVLHHTRTSTSTDALTTPTASEFHQGDVSRMYIGRG